MTLLGLIIFLVIIGLLLWLVTSVIPTTPPWLRTVLIVLVVLFAVIWLANSAGLMSGGLGTRIGS